MPRVLGLHQLQQVLQDRLRFAQQRQVVLRLSERAASLAYERTSLIVTTNLPFEAWPEVCGSKRLTGATLDRLTHRVHILEANGESYRLRDSKQRLTGRKG
jgi:hypothetical protein